MTLKTRVSRALPIASRAVIRAIDRPHSSDSGGNGGTAPFWKTEIGCSSPLSVPIRAFVRGIFKLTSSGTANISMVINMASIGTARLSSVGRGVVVHAKEAIKATRQVLLITYTDNYNFRASSFIDGMLLTAIERYSALSSVAKRCQMRPPAVSGNCRRPARPKHGA